MSTIDELARKVYTYFDRINREVFEGDPAANPELTIEIVSRGIAHDTPVLVLVTPWTLIGLAFPPDGNLPSTLRLGASHYTVLANEVDEIGSYFSILLVPDVSAYTTQEQVVAEARPLAEKMHLAVEKSRVETTQVEDGDRRALFRAVKGSAQPAPRSELPFGSPDGPALSSGET